MLIVDICNAVMIRLKANICNAVMIKRTYKSFAFRHIFNETKVFLVQLQHISLSNFTYLI